MFNLGGGEILVILVVALIVLGPDKLPRFMRTVGKAVGDLRCTSTDFQRTMNLELAEKETDSDEKKRNTGGVHKFV
jgi:sec-independent protein translocase protein TatB